jgi:hypothetical protein
MSENTSNIKLSEISIDSNSTFAIVSEDNNNALKINNGNVINKEKHEEKISATAEDNSAGETVSNRKWDTIMDPRVQIQIEFEKAAIEHNQNVEYWDDLMLRAARLNVIDNSELAQTTIYDAARKNKMHEVNTTSCK